MLDQQCNKAWMPPRLRAVPAGRVASAALAYQPARPPFAYTLFLRMIEVRPTQVHYRAWYPPHDRAIYISTVPD
jgi:hypothetical protein